MAQLNIAAINEILRDEIDPKVADTTNPPRFFLDKVLADASEIYPTVGSKTFYTEFKLKTQKAMGLGPRGAAGDMPVHVSGKWDTARVSLCRWYTTGEYDGPLANIKNANEIVDAINDTLSDVKSNIKYQQEVSFIGNGNPAIAHVVDGSHGGNYTTYTCIENEWWPGTRRLQAGLWIDSYDDSVGYGSGTIGLDAGSPAVAGEERIWDVPSSTTFRQKQGSETNIDGDYIFFADGSGSQVDAYPAGITSLIDGPNYGSSWESTGGQSNESVQNIDGTSLTFWQATVNSAASARYLDEEILLDVADAIIIKIGEDAYAKTDPILLSQRAIQSRLRKDKARDNSWVNKTELIAGVQVVKIVVNERELPWVLDEACGVNVLHWIDTNSLLYKALPMERMDPEGYVRVIGANGLGTDAYRVQYKQYSQMGTRRRDTHATIRDLKVTG